MANKKYDGVVEAVHYGPDGQVDWVRLYLRRGPTWSDRLIMRRDDLVKEIKSGKKMALGQRVLYMAGTFEYGAPIQVVGSQGKETLVTAGASQSNQERDSLEGAPVI